MFQLCSAAKSLLSQGAQNRKLLHSKHISQVNFRNANKEHVILDITNLVLSYIIVLTSVVSGFSRGPLGENVGGKIQNILDNS